MAAPKNKIRLESRFPAVKKGMYEAVQQARDRALDEGEAEAEKRIERVNNARGYNLPADIEQEKTGNQSGLIRHPEWFMRFFEFGTVYIPPSPFMRPAHRKMRKRFLDELGDNAEPFIRRKVGAAPVNEEALASAYLVEYLEADAELMSTANAVTIAVRWARLPSPFVKIDRLGSSDLMAISVYRIWADLTYLIRVVQHWEGSGPPDWSTVNDLAHRLDALLHGHEEQTADLEVHSFREESYTDAILEGNGELWMHAGGVYRVRARSLAVA